MNEASPLIASSPFGARLTIYASGQTLARDMYKGDSISGDFDASVGLGGVVGGVSDSQQQQPEYNLLRVLMESQLEYYNSFRSRNPARSPSQPQHSPQPGPSSTS